MERMTDLFLSLKRQLSFLNCVLDFVKCRWSDKLIQFYVYRFLIVQLLSYNVGLLVMN